jgi:hypothetical protein
MFERPRLLLWEDTASDILLLDLSPAIVSPLPPFCFFNTLFKLVFGTDSVLLSQSANIFYHHHPRHAFDSWKQKEKSKSLNHLPNWIIAQPFHSLLRIDTEFFTESVLQTRISSPTWSSRTCWHDKLSVKCDHKNNSAYCKAQLDEKEWSLWLHITTRKEKRERWNRA